MAATDLIMPKMGESIMEATILSWLKEEGDTIEIDEAVIEIATDKVDSEVPSPVAGVLKKRLFNEGDVVPVGQAVAVIDTEGVETTVSAPAAAPKPAPAQVAATVSSVPVAQAATSTVAHSNGNGRFYSPLVLNIARKEQIGMTELETLPGTGKDGRVTKKDILSYLKTRGNQPAPVAQPTPSVTKTVETPVSKAPATSFSGDVEIVQMDRMRKLIADHMVRSKHTSPHVTSFVEADVTNLVAWRNRVKDDFFKKHGEKITFTPLFIDALVRAIKDFPNINISVDGDQLLIKKNINIGMAAALPSGNLIVPVIKNADHLNLLGITKQVNDLARRARENKLKPHEIEGGTYTLTNVGTFGNVMGTPIINQPQVAIMAAGAIRKKPAVIETPQGDTIGIRSMMFLSHSYDHRVVDGFLGGSFVRRVADYLENWDLNTAI